MDTIPIRIPGKRQPSTWQIPVITDVDERKAMEDFDTYERLLLAYGFTRLLHTRSASHSSFSYNAQDRKTEDYVLWSHPAGLIAHGNSYTSGGYYTSGSYTSKGPDGVPRVVPVTRKLSSLTVSARVDCGTGGELQHRAAVALSGLGSGGTDPQLDGTNVRNVSHSFHSNAGTLAPFLIHCQEQGKFLPLARWPRKSEHSRQLFLPAELLFPLEAPPAATPEECKTFLQQQDWPELGRRVAAHLPEEFRFLFVPPMEKQEHQDSPGPRQRKGLRWDPVELGIDKFSEALFFAKKRWAGSFDSPLLTHWSEAALGEHGDDYRAWRPYEQGPAGLSLPVTLLYAKPAVSRPDILMDLLANAPEDIVHRWATHPDAAGYTLGLHAINRIFVERGVRHAIPLETVLGVLRVLHDRLGDEGLPMATSTRSVLGLPLQFCPAETSPDKSFQETQDEFRQVIECLEGWKLPWHENLRWRNYPNLYKKEEGRPCFFRQDGPVSAVAWLDAMGSRARNGSRVVATMLVSRELGLALPDSRNEATNRRARI